MLSLEIGRIVDLLVRENFRRLSDYLNRSPFVTGDFRAFEVTFSAAETKKVAHGFNFVPKDVFITSIGGGISITPNFDTFDSEFIYLTSTGPGHATLLAGRLKRSS